MKAISLFLIIIITILPALSFANTIRVNASASVRAEPDQTFTSIEIVTRDKTASLSQQGMAVYTKGIIVKLLELGLKKDSFSVSHNGVSPEYKYNNGKQILVGYRSSSRLELTLKISEKDPHKIIAALTDVKKGSTNSTLHISSTQYQVSNTEEYEIKAAIQALANAKAKAEAILNSQSLKLGKVIQIDNNISMHHPGPVTMIDMAAKSESYLPIDQVKSQEISATVNASFEIAGQ